MKILVNCKTEDCPQRNKPVEIDWDGQSSVKLAQLRECPHCGVLRMSVSQACKQALKDLSLINVGRISSMSPQDRKVELKKRSTAHYHEKIKERKKFLDSEVFKP
jgi:hypothetical protein